MNTDNIIVEIEVFHIFTCIVTLRAEPPLTSPEEVKGGSARRVMYSST